MLALPNQDSFFNPIAKANLPFELLTTPRSVDPVALQLGRDGADIRASKFADMNYHWIELLSRARCQFNIATDLPFIDLGCGRSPHAMKSLLFSQGFAKYVGVEKTPYKPQEFIPEKISPDFSTAYPHSPSEGCYMIEGEILNFLRHTPPRAAHLAIMSFDSGVVNGDDFDQALAEQIHIVLPHNGIIMHFNSKCIRSLLDQFGKSYKSVFHAIDPDSGILIKQD